MKTFITSLTAPIIFLMSNPSYAGLIETYFKNPDNSTKWQHVANFSSSVLITLLSVAAITLYFSVKRTNRVNKALKGIRADLEIRVKERTENLNKSNTLLTESNERLLAEITQHKETGERLQTSEEYINNILQSMPSMLISLDKDMKVTHWNKYAEEITGVDYKVAIGQNLWDVYPAITISRDEVQGVLDTNKSMSIKHSQRGQYYFDITVFPLRGKIESGVVISIDNVTQRSIAENMLIQRDKLSSMGELAATVAHDIDTPLKTMLDDIQQLRENVSAETLDTLDEETQAQFKDALEQGHKASNILSNLLDFSRSQGDKKREVQLTEVVEHAINLAEKVLTKKSAIVFKDITIERNFDSVLPLYPCYVSELQQVFFSLLRHAYLSLVDTEKSDDDDWQPTITIELAKNYDAIWAKVQHNGKGLTVAQQQDIFEPFFTTVMGEERGSIEQRLSFSQFIICEHHHGQIAITSDLKIGTTFHLELPLL